MSAVPFDTLKLADRLAAGGFTEEQARTAASALSEAFKDDIATKADIATLKSDIEHLDQKIGALDATMNQKIGALDASMNQKIGALEAGMNQKIGALDHSLNEKIEKTELRLQANIESSKSDILKWIIGAIGFQTVIILGAAVTIARGLPH